MKRNRKGTIRGVLVALILMLLLTWLFDITIDIDGLSGHQIAELSIAIWLASCLGGLLVHFLVNRKPSRRAYR